MALGAAGLMAAGTSGRGVTNPRSWCRPGAFLPLPGGAGKATSGKGETHAGRSIPAAHDSWHEGRWQAGPSAGWTGAIVRVLFGVIFAIDAALKWLPRYRSTYISQLKSVAHGQPWWLHGWFQFWIHLQSAGPGLFATLTGLAETALAACLLLGLGRRAGYLAGAGYTPLIWAVGEGFGGPYVAGSTDVGTGIVYALLFITLLAFAPPARPERFSLDRVLAPRWPWWRFAAEPHAVDRVRGTPVVEPVVVGEHQPGRQPGQHQA